MTELSPDLKKLVNIAQDAMSPSEQQVNAVRDALKARLGESSGPQGSGPGGGGSPLFGAWSALHIVGIGCVVLGVIAGAVELWGKAGRAARPVREQAVVMAPPPSAAGAAMPVPVPEVAQEEPAAAPVVEERAARKLRHRGGRRDVVGRVAVVRSPSPSPSTNTSTLTTLPLGQRDPSKGAAGKVAGETSSAVESVSVVGGPKPSDDVLAQEVALLARARAALTRGQPAVALALAEQHASRFPRGAMRQEQLATRMRALCALGRGSDARSVLHELELTSRRSPHLMTIDARCLNEAGSREVP